MSTPYYRLPELPADLKAYLASVGPTARAAILGQHAPVPPPMPAPPVAPMAAEPTPATAQPAEPGYGQLAALRQPPALGLPTAPAPQLPGGPQYSELAALRQPPPLALPNIPGEQPQTAPVVAPQPRVEAAPTNVPTPAPRQSAPSAVPPSSGEQDDGGPGLGAIIPLEISGALGGIADSLSHLGNRGAQRSGLQAQAQQKIANLRARAAKAEAAEKEAAERALQAEMDDVGSTQSLRMQSGPMGQLAQSVGLDPTKFSATQLVAFGKNPAEIHGMARQFQSDARQVERDERTAAAEGAKTSADSDLSKRYRDSMRDLFGRLRMDPSMISDSMSYAEIVDPNGAVQSALGERRAMASGGIRPGGAQGGLSGPQTGPIGTGSGDITTPADALAVTLKGAYPRGAVPENFDARVRQIMTIRDESQRKEAILAVEREGLRAHEALKQFRGEAEKWQKMKVALDAVRGDVAQYKGDLPGAGVEALPTLIAQKLPFVGGEASMLDAAAQATTLSKAGRVQRGKLNMLNESYKRTQSGAAIGLSEDEKFKVQTGIAAGASDEQVLEALEVFSNYFDSNWNELKAGNPEGADIYERNLGGQKPKGDAETLSALPPGVEEVQ